MSRDAATCQQNSNTSGGNSVTTPALVALQLAVDAPNLIHTLRLLEPAVPSPSSDGDLADGEDSFA